MVSLVESKEKVTQFVSENIDLPWVVDMGFRFFLSEGVTLTGFL